MSEPELESPQSARQRKLQRRKEQRVERRKALGGPLPSQPARQLVRARADLHGDHLWGAVFRLRFQSVCLPRGADGASEFPNGGREPVVVREFDRPEAESGSAHTFMIHRAHKMLVFRGRRSSRQLARRRSRPFRKGNVRFVETAGQFLAAWWIDAAIAGVLVIFAAIGYLRGGLLWLADLAVLAVAILLAFRFFPAAGEWLGALLSLPPRFGAIAGFVALFIAVQLVLGTAVSLFWRFFSPPKVHGSLRVINGLAGIPLGVLFAAVSISMILAMGYRLPLGPELAAALDESYLANGARSGGSTRTVRRPRVAVSGRGRAPIRRTPAGRRPGGPSAVPHGWNCGVRWPRKNRLSW